MNIALSPMDYNGSKNCHSNVHAKEMFSLFAEDFNLVDVWRRDHEKEYGFTRYQQSPPVFSRIDYIFVSSDLISMVK